MGFLAVEGLFSLFGSGLHNKIKNHQIRFFNFFFQKIYGEFELMGVPEAKLNAQQWQSIEQRMQTEEAACVLTGAEAEENG